MSTLRNARFATLLAVALVLVITGAVSGAAGQALILGASNSAGGSTTSLTANVAGAVLKVTQNGPGTPLTITGPSDKAPMNVSSSRKVTNLNADRVDGQSAAAFMPSATYITSKSQTVAPNSVGGINAPCDAGDVLLGGGFWNVGATTHLWDSYPLDSQTWRVLVTTGASANAVYAYAVCADLGAAHITTLAVEEPQRDEPLPTSGD